MLQQAIIRQMGVTAYRAAFEGKRMAFRHGAGPAVLLHPGAAPGTTFMLDGEDAVIDATLYNPTTLEPSLATPPSMARAAHNCIRFLDSVMHYTSPNLATLRWRRHGTPQCEINRQS